MVNKNIKEFFEKGKKWLTNVEILAIVNEFNPYCSVNDIDKSRYNKNRETKIFDYINSSEISNTFVNNFNI